MSNENSQKFKIGCHLSASKGFLNMGKEIVALGFSGFTCNKQMQTSEVVEIQESNFF